MTTQPDAFGPDMDVEPGKVPQLVIDELRESYRVAADYSGAFNDAAPTAPSVQRSLHIVFDGPPSPDSGRFVEVEDASGRSVRIGAWRERADGLWELVIPAIAAIGNDAALRADAERYRWLREVGTPTLGRIAHANSGVLKHGYSTPEAVLDALARGDASGA